jgi:hypothetical protein
VRQEQDVKLHIVMDNLFAVLITEEITPPAVDVEEVHDVKLDEERVTLALTEGTVKRVGPLVVLLMEVKEEEEIVSTAPREGREKRGEFEYIVCQVTVFILNVPVDVI